MKSQATAAYKGAKSVQKVARTSSVLPRAHLDLGTHDRERLRSALHGGLGQLLTSISFLASTLRQQLAEKNLPEASHAAEILSLTGRAISETQALVHEDEPERRTVSALARSEKA